MYEQPSLESMLDRISAHTATDPNAVVGQGSSDDGVVTVGYTPAEPVRELRIDPRAVRMPVRELSAAIEDAVANAKKDYESRRPPAAMDKDALRENLTAFTTAAAQDPDALIKVMQSRLGPGKTA